MLEPRRLFSTNDNDPHHSTSLHPSGVYTTVTHDSTTLVIFADGACSHNGSTMHPPAAAFGVHFATGSHLNRGGRLRPDVPHTSQSAELYAAMVALGMFHLRRRTPRFRGIERVVVVVDSTYVADAMAKWVYKWIDNGWTKANGTDVKNRKMLSLLHRKIDRIAKQGVVVQFWKVGREANGDADALAKGALAF